MFEVRDQFDIRGYTFEEFVAFVFDHEIPPEFDWNGRRSKAWYHKADVECSRDVVTRFYTRLFSEPGFLLDRFSKEKLEQGFWAIMGQSMECCIGEVVWNEEVAFEQRADCIRSMFHLYEKLFSIDPLETSSHMWWDALAHDWHSGNRSRSKGGEDLLMQDVMFDTLERILGLSSEHCQAAALHGLGHLHHPSTTALVNRYLDRNPNLDSETRDYALAAARFEVL